MSAGADLDWGWNVAGRRRPLALGIDVGIVEAS